MKIGLIFYSRTGNTSHVLKTLSTELKKVGRESQLDEVIPMTESLARGPIQLKQIPNVSAYDVIVFASPVHGFQLSNAMVTYLKQLESLQEKKIFCLVTHYFPYAWLGGKKSIKQMTKVCSDKGGEIVETFIIDWSRKSREKQITNTVNSIISLMEDIDER